MDFFKNLFKKIKRLGPKRIKIAKKIKAIKSPAKVLKKPAKKPHQKYRYPNEREKRLMQTLHPHIQKLVKAILWEARKAGLAVYLFEAERTWKRQASLYGRGRKDGKIIDKKRVVTYARPGSSYHNYGLAVDLVFDGNKKKPGVQWSWDAVNRPETLKDEAAERRDGWKRLGAIGMKYGLEWAGTWNRFPEMPHFQFTAGLKIKKLKLLYLKGKKKAVWAEIDRRLAT